MHKQVIWLLALALLVGTLLAVPHLLLLGAGAREEEMRQAWRLIGRPLEDVPLEIQLPYRNESAYTLDRLAARLDLEIIQDDVGSPNRTPFDDQHDLVDAYVIETLNHTSEIYPLPSTEALQYLAAHHEDFEAIRNHLLFSEIPEWGELWKGERNEPELNLVHLGQLQRLHLGQALYHAALGNDGMAGEYLESSWILLKSLDRHPFCISQLVHLGLYRRQMAVLRKLESASEIWPERIREVDAFENMVSAWTYEAWRGGEMSVDDVLDLNDLGGPTQWYHELLWDLGPKRKYHALLIAEYRLMEAHEIADFQRSRTFAFDTARHCMDIQVDRSWLNPFDDCYLAGAWDRVRRTQLEEELTLKVFEARAARAAAGGTWPSEIPGFEASRFPDISWVYEMDENGDVTIRTAQAIPPGKPDWPTEFTSAPPPPPPPKAPSPCN